MTPPPSPLGPADAKLASALHEATMEAPWSEASFRELLMNPSLLGFAYRGGAARLDALLLMSSVAGEAEVYTIAVAPNRRRAGLARGLMAHGMEAVRAAGAQSVFLEVDEGNAAARTLYATLGFLPVGRRHGYYEAGSGADAILMRLDLDHSNFTGRRAIGQM